jgi:acyl transferase domain-containing protein
LEHNQIPPNVFFQTPNPRIPFKEGNLHVPVETESWPVGRRERVSVNCFGVGGANAHTILDSFSSFCGSTRPRQMADVCRRSSRLLVTSSRSADALQKRMEDLGEYIEKFPERLHDLAYTLAIRREHLSHRAFAIVDPDSNIEQSSISFETGRSKSVALALVFTGQGAQWPGMGSDLMKEFPEVLKTIQSLDQTLQNLSDAPEWMLEGLDPS